MKVIRLDKGIYAKVDENRVYHMVLPAYGFTPAMKKTDYLACGFHEDGSLNVVVAGVSLARAKKMIKAWGTPLDPFMMLDEVKQAFGIGE